MYVMLALNTNSWEISLTNNRNLSQSNVFFLFLSDEGEGEGGELTTMQTCIYFSQTTSS